LIKEVYSFKNFLNNLTNSKIIDKNIETLIMGGKIEEL